MFPITHITQDSSKSFVQKISKKTILVLLVNVYAEIQLGNDPVFSKFEVALFELIQK